MINTVLFKCLLNVYIRLAKKANKKKKNSAEKGLKLSRRKKKKNSYSDL